MASLRRTVPRYGDERLKQWARHHGLTRSARQGCGHGLLGQRGTCADPQCASKRLTDHPILWKRARVAGRARGRLDPVAPTARGRAHTLAVRTGVPGARYWVARFGSATGRGVRCR